jgi:hypothetical protein
MSQWLQPGFLRRPSAGGVRLPSLLLLSVLLAAAGAELKTDWIERVIGAYLVTTNSARPESGAIWEKGRKARSARTAVEKLATDREVYQRMARNAGSLTEIVSTLNPGQGVMLSAEHFRELYRKLPQGIASEMVSPYDLLRFGSDGRWVRSYLERSSDGLVVYLLEPNNHVLHQFKVASAPLALLVRRSADTSQSLEDLPGFQNRIYPADRFFQTLAALPEEERRGLLPQPERLLEVSGQVVRVGISDEAISGFVDIGLEIRHGTQRRVMLVQGQDWAVWRLRSLLEGKSQQPAGPSTFKTAQEVHSPQ